MADPLSVGLLIGASLGWAGGTIFGWFAHPARKRLKTILAIVEEAAPSG